MYSDKSSYKYGEPIKLFIEPRQDCSLTLVNISPKGEMCILFPNTALDNSPIKAGQQFVYPPRGQMVGEIIGTETFQAFCNTSDAAVRQEGRSLPEVSCVVGGDIKSRTKAKDYLSYEVSVDLGGGSAVSSDAADLYKGDNLKKATLKLEVHQ
jgi:hypothetical protein